MKRCIWASVSSFGEVVDVDSGIARRTAYCGCLCALDDNRRNTSRLHAAKTLRGRPGARQDMHQRGSGGSEAHGPGSDADRSAGTRCNTHEHDRRILPRRTRPGRQLHCARSQLAVRERGSARSDIRWACRWTYLRATTVLAPVRLGTRADWHRPKTILSTRWTPQPGALCGVPTSAVRFLVRRCPAAT